MCLLFVFGFTEGRKKNKKINGLNILIALWLPSMKFNFLVSFDLNTDEKNAAIQVNMPIEHFTTIADKNATEHQIEFRHSRKATKTALVKEYLQIH